MNDVVDPHWRLTAAKLLTVYGQGDAPDFIANNTPDTPATKRGERVKVIIDPGLRALIKARTDDGRVICMFLIDVMEGRVEGIHVGLRASAAKELLNRAFGKTLGRSLPRASRSTASRRSTQKMWIPASAGMTMAPSVVTDQSRTPPLLEN